MKKKIIKQFCKKISLLLAISVGTSIAQEGPLPNQELQKRIKSFKEPIFYRLFSKKDSNNKNIGINDVDFSPDNGTIAAALKNNRVIIWDLNNGKQIRTFDHNHNKSVIAVTFNPEGNRILSTSYSGIISLWDTESGKPIWNTPVCNKLFCSSAFSKDGKNIVSASCAGIIKLLNTNDGKEIWVKHIARRNDKWRINSVKFSPDSKTIVAALGGGVAALGGGFIKLLNTNDGKKIWVKHIAGRNDKWRINSVKFSPDSNTIVAALSGGFIMLLNTYDGKPIRTIQNHRNEVNSAEFSHDGNNILSASRDKTIKLYNSRKDTGFYTFRDPTIQKNTAHNGSVNYAGFNTDGSRIASTSDDKTIKLWTGETGQHIWTMNTKEEVVSSIEFSNDGSKIAYVLDDGTIHMWSLTN